MRPIVLALAALGQGEPALRVGRPVSGEISDADALVRAPALDDARGEPARGDRFRIEVQTPGPHWIELRTSRFDAYLVLREGERVLAEDDDGAGGWNARVVARIEGGAELVVEAASLHGGRGPYEIELFAGEPPKRAVDEVRERGVADLRAALAACESALGPDHPDAGTAHVSLGLALSSAKDLEGARPHLERGLAIFEATRGPRHADTAWALSNLANVMRRQGDRGARSCLERSVVAHEAAYGPDHPRTADACSNLGNLLRDAGESARARALVERALAIREKAFGPDHAQTLGALNDLVLLLHAQERHAEAVPHAERIVRFYERLHGPEHVDVAVVVGNLAAILREQGELRRARALQERSLAIFRKLAPEDPMVGLCLHMLAAQYRAEGDLVAARRHVEEALSIREAALGPRHPETAESLELLGDVLFQQGDLVGARDRCERSLAIREEVQGPDHPALIEVLWGLASVHHARGEHASTLRLLERALAIAEAKLGPDHPATATSLGKIGHSYAHLDETERALPYLERGLELVERHYGPDHLRTALALEGLAEGHQFAGSRELALPLFERALAIFETTLGPEHPTTIGAIHSVAVELAIAGHTDRASALFEREWASESAWRRSLLVSFSEREALAHLASKRQTLGRLLSLMTADAFASRGAQRVLDWKGQWSRLLSTGHQRIVETLDAEQVESLDRLREARARLSMLAFRRSPPDPAAHREELTARRLECERLESAILGTLSLAVPRAPSLESVRRGLPPGSALIDFLVHESYRPPRREGERIVERGRWIEDRVSAWITRPDRGDPVRVDLGPAAELESAVASRLASARAGAEEEDVARGVGGREGREGEVPASRLRDRLWEPLAPHLRGVRLVFVCPDAFLGAVPFETLQQPDGTFLVEHATFVYLQSPAALVRSEPGRARFDSLLVAGDIDYAGAAPHGEDAPRESSSPAADLRGGFPSAWAPLPQAAIEAEAVAAQHEATFPGGERVFLRGAAATEAALRGELGRHAVLHVATHGFFNPEGIPSLWESAIARGTDERFGNDEELGLVGTRPGLLAGLVCAGANDPGLRGDDGYLTAEELGWLDLSEVELVVLSACETAVGRAEAGEGLLGLRRAFEVAGAKTVISSLWAVEDDSTSRLMRDFYENLWRRKMGRAEALRAAQLAMLARNRAEHGEPRPSTWGAFVLSGEWR